MLLAEVSANEVVDTMDLSPLLAKYEGGGAPAYHPVMMLKVIIYAYSRDIYSSRSMAPELKTDTAFMFLSGLQSPDFRTICLFRAEQADVLPDLYVEVVKAMCLQFAWEIWQADRRGHAGIQGRTTIDFGRCQSV